MTEKLQVTYRNVSDLIPYARNARTHSDEQVAEIAASIKEYGWTDPILVDGENGIISGHGRLQAARKLKLEKVPVIELAGLTETQKRAYILAANKIALNAGWDDDLLKIEIEELKAEGFNLDLTGFSEAEITNLFTGWESDIPTLEPESDEAPQSRLVIKFAQYDELRAKEAITNALEEAGIEYVYS